jgi:disabled homolog 2
MYIFFLEKTMTPTESKPHETSESWAVFEPDEALKSSKDKSLTPTNVKVTHKEIQPPEKDSHSPYSSDGKNEYKQREKEYHRRWPKAHTSSSSRDVSPWDEDAPQTGDSRRRPRPHHHHESHHHHPSDRYTRPPPPPRRRINSCDEEYDEEYERRPLPPRLRATKGPVYRSKEILDSENPNWHYSDEDDVEKMERNRQFDRNALRSTYGPPTYDKKDLKSLPYERRDYKTHEKRSKYYRANRNDYEYDSYEMPPPMRGKLLRKDFDDYEENFERGSRESRSARDYFYDRDRKSFDSNESYDSGRGHRMGSSEICGSYEGGRENYRDRERYISRSLRRNQRTRGGPDEDDTEEDATRRPSGETGSLQRSSGQRSKHIQLDDEVWGIGPGGKHWKRPSSASAGDRMSGSGGLSDDNEKEKRNRRKPKAIKGKEIEIRPSYATNRYPQHQRREFFDYEDDDNERVTTGGELSPRNVSPRSNDPEASAYFASRRKHGAPNSRANTTPRSETKSFSEYSKPVPSRYPEDEEFESRSRGQSRGQYFKKSGSRDMFTGEPKDMYSSVKSNIPGFEDNDSVSKKHQNVRKQDFNTEEQAHLSTQQQQPNSNKFNFDGFDSDFNSSPKIPEQQKNDSAQKFSFETEFSPSMPKNPNSQKLRFNENVSISKFDAESSSQQMFEDDFLEWTPEAPSTGSNIHSSLKKMPGSNLKMNSTLARHESIKNSDSVSIFSRKTDEDPFENDDFFNDEGKEETNRNDQDFDWSHKNNFANFDDNKNI